MIRVFTETDMDAVLSIWLEAIAGVFGRQRGIR